MIEILFLVLPVFIVLILGNMLKRFGIIDDMFIASSNKLIFKVTLPALLFFSTSKSDLKSVLDWRLIAIMLVSVSFVVLLSFVTAKFMKLEKAEVGSFAMNCFRGNYANMALPVFFYVFGEEGFMSAGVLLAFIVPFVNMLSVLSLSYSSVKEKKLAPMLLSAVFNPLTIACMMGLLCSALGIRLPEFIMKSISIVSEVTLPLALFCVGYAISLASMKRNFFLSSACSVIKMIVGPAFALLLLHIFNIEMTLGAKAMIIFMSAPSGTANYIMAVAMGGKSDLTASTIVTTHCFSIITFIFWLRIVGV
jgi:predicted permease